MNIKRLLGGRLCLLLALIMLGTALPAQTRKSNRRKKSRTTKVKTPKTVFTAVPADSLIGKVYAGKVGQTVVDFFGNRKTYGDVTQQIYLWHDNIAVVNQRGGDIETYNVMPYSQKGTAITIGAFTYNTTKDARSIVLKKTKENNEVRQGTLMSIDPTMMVNAIFHRGKYLDRMTIQTDEDKANALTCLNIAAEYGNKDAKTYLYNYYKKRADKGEKYAINHMLRHETTNANYDAAHHYCDRLIEQEPQNPELICEKGMLYLKENKYSEAKKMYKKVKKLDKQFYETSKNTFMEAMRKND